LAEKPADPFTDLLTRLVRVPKDQIDQKDREFKKREGKAKRPAQAGQILPMRKKRAG
jgi:hypothetical protein